jgi:hypothetical protein
MNYHNPWLRKATYGLGLLAAWVLVHTLVITWDGLRMHQHPGRPRCGFGQ